MPSVLVRTMLFLSSYFPLALIFFFLFVEQQPLWATAILAIGVLGLVIMLLYFFSFAQRFAPIQEKITGVHGRDAEPMSYIASYLIPFVALPFSGWQQGTALLILIVVLGIVYVNSNMIHINPMLNLLGYHLYEITLEDSKEAYSLITRRRIGRGETLHLVDIGEGIFIEKGGRK